MSYTKNLGRVKGKKGNYFVPNDVYIDRSNDNYGKIAIDWVETIVSDEETPEDESKTTYLDAPIFVPNYEESTGDLSFTPTVPMKINGQRIDPSTPAFVYHIKGEKGDPGETKLNVEFITNLNPAQVQYEIDTQWMEVETELYGMANPTIENAKNLISQYVTYKTDTLYVFTPNETDEIHPIYVYYESDITDSRLLPDIRELRKLQDISLDLDNYYTKSQTYSRTDIDDYIDVQNIYLEKIYELLDVPNDVYNIGGQEISNEVLNNLIDEKLEGYVKLENVKYVDIEGTIYFVPYGIDIPEESNNGE